MFFHTFTASAPRAYFRIDVPDGVRRPVRAAEALHGECRGEVKMPGIGREQLVGYVRLPRQGRKIRVVDVDRQNLESVLRRNLQEHAVGSVHMHVRIEFVNAREVFERCTAFRRPHSPATEVAATVAFPGPRAIGSGGGGGGGSGSSGKHDDAQSRCATWVIHLMNILEVNRFGLSRWRVNEIKR